MLEETEFGRSEGKVPGPLPGKGAVIHENSGEDDFDGLPGDALPPKKNVKIDGTRQRNNDKSK